MVTVHYSNTITEHPDTSLAYAHRRARQKAEGLCFYGFRCEDCALCVAHNREPDCKLYKNKELKNDCPGHLRQKERGKLSKTFGIDFHTYSAIADRTAFMYHNRTYKLIFVVLSLPPFKRETNGKEINEAFSRFIENLRANYHLRHYLVVREGNGTTERFHYHAILDIPYVSFTNLNSAWNSSLSNFCDFSSCAFRTKRKSYFIRDIAGAIRYISKYISKSINQRSESRVFFCDSELARAVVIKHFDYIDELPETPEGFKSLRRKVLNDYVCRITFASKRDQNVFFHTVVKKIFDSDWITPGLIIYSDSPPD